MAYIGNKKILLTLKAEKIEAENDDFWDYFQQNGERNLYRSAFVMWQGECFYPKYDFAPIVAEEMFCEFQGIMDLSARLRECGVKLDTSKLTTRANRMFRTCSITRIPELDFSNYTGDLTDTFSNSGRIHTIEKLILNTNIKYTNTFNKTSALANITIEGKIGNAIDFSSCKLLTRASIESIINALSGDISNTVTLSQTAVNNAFTNEEWAALIANKPSWTISLV